MLRWTDRCASAVIINTLSTNFHSQRRRSSTFSPWASQKKTRHVVYSVALGYRVWCTKIRLQHWVEDKRRVWRLRRSVRKSHISYFSMSPPIISMCSQSMHCVRQFVYLREVCWSLHTMHDWLSLLRCKFELLVTKTSNHLTERWRITRILYEVNFNKKKHSD